MTAQISKQTYLQSYLNLVKSAGSEEPSKLLNYVLGKDCKVTTKVNNLNSIISLAKSGDISIDVEELKKRRDELQSEIKKNVGRDNQGKYREKIDKVHIEDIDHLLSKLRIDRHKSDSALEDYVLLGLMWPSPSRNDLQEVVLCNNYRNRGKGNCIYLPKKADANGELRINEHKTTSRGGKPIIRPMDKDLTDAVRRLFSDGRTYLFSTKRDKPLTSSAFSHKLSNFFSNYIGVPLSSTALRKIYLSGKYRGVKQQMKKDAKMMGHSENVAQSHYIDNTVDED